jgi:hypothetical protein
MMGFQGTPARLFYDFCLEEHCLQTGPSGRFRLSHLSFPPHPFAAPFRATV